MEKRAILKIKYSGLTNKQIVELADRISDIISDRFDIYNVSIITGKLKVKK